MSLCSSLDNTLEHSNPYVLFTVELYTVLPALSKKQQKSGQFAVWPEEKGLSEEKGFRSKQGEVAQLDLDKSLSLKHSHYSDLFVFGQLVLTFSDSPMWKVIVH